jgi:hypothetical protein
MLAFPTALRCNSNFWPYNGGGLGTNYFTGGNVGSSQSPPYVSVGSVDLSSGETIAVTITSNQVLNAMKLELTDATTGTSFLRFFTGVDIGSAVGGDSAYVGFTGGDGLGTSIQVLDHFKFTNDLSAPPFTQIPESSTLSVVMISLAVIFGAYCTRRSRSTTSI